MSTKFRKFKTWNPDTNQYESALAFEGDLIDDTTASATKTYSSNKIQSLAGAQIDDDETSNTKVWSSGKVYNELESAKSEFVALTDLDGTTIYKGSDDKIHAQGGSSTSVIDDTTTSTSKTYSSSKIESVITSKGYKTETEVNSLIDAKIQALGNAESESY